MSNEEQDNNINPLLSEDEDRLREAEKNKENTNNKNEKEIIIKDENEEENKGDETQKVNSTKGIKAIIYISLSIILSAITNIFFKAGTISSSPIYVTYFQSLSFIVFLPLSFVTLQFGNLFYKKINKQISKVKMSLYIKNLLL